MPDHSRFDAIPEIALDWFDQGRGAALATVVQTWGSAPRRVGSQLVVDASGAMEGSVSGGCVEGAVVVEAQEALADGRPRLLEYGVSDGDAFAVGLACGGTIKVLVEPVGRALPRAVLADLVAARAARRAVAYRVDVQTGGGQLIAADANDLPDDLRAAFRADRALLDNSGQIFIAIHNPPLRLIIVGAVHIAQALVPMAQIAGFDPILIDPRGGFAAPERFGGRTIIDDWPDEALAALGLDARSALVLLTHDPKLDDPAIQAALASDAFYIGALGSKRTHAARVDRLRAYGFMDDQINRIHGPIGLNIGAANPAEISVSILGQMIEQLRGPRP